MKKTNPLFDAIHIFDAIHNIACNFEPSCECERESFDDAVCDIMTAVWRFVLWQKSITCSNCTDDHEWISGVFAEELNIVRQVTENTNVRYTIVLREFDIDGACGDSE